MICQEHLTIRNCYLLQSTNLIGRRWLSECAFEVEFSRPQDFFYEAGQTIQMVHGDLKRYYSLASAPSDSTLLLCVNFVNTQGFSSLLASAEIGSRFTFNGPHGFFTWAPSPRPSVFIGTDTGIAPFLSMARSGIDGFILLHGARSENELHYRSAFQRIATKYLPCVWDTPDGDIEYCEQFHRKMVDLLANHLQSGRYDFFLCGWQKMIKDVTLLIDESYPDSHVYTEVFY